MVLGPGQVAHIEQCPILTLRNGHTGGRQRGINEGLDCAGIHQRTIPTRDATEGDKIILEPEFVASLESDAVSNAREVLGHVPKGDRLGGVRHGGHQRVKVGREAEDAATFTEALHRPPGGVPQLPHDEVGGVAQDERGH
jgi:hypothetical protein